jgi:hypothetical protein
MSKMADLLIEIEELDAKGYNITNIADMIGVPVQFVLDALGEIQYNDSMDGDFDSAMASAGMGTDEDYGYYGESEDSF